MAVRRAAAAASTSLISSSPRSNLFSTALLTSLLPHISPQTPSPTSPLPRPFRIPLPPKCPLFRRIQTLPQIPPPPHPTPTLQSAATSAEVIAVIEAMESSLDEHDERLGAACFEAAERLDSIGHQDLDRALAFAFRALQFFERKDGGWSVSVAKVLRLMGSISCKMMRFNDSLESLNTAAQILDALRRENSRDDDALKASVAVQLQLSSTKTAMGRRREALINLRKSLDLKRSILEHTSSEMGAAYKDLAEAYVVVLDFDEALPLALRALEIYGEQFGEYSAEVVQIRRLLGVIYTGLGENDEALEQNELSRRVLESLSLDEELLQVGIDAANILIELGRLDQAISYLKWVIQKTDKECETRASVLISMAQALCNQEKFGDSRRCLEIASGILDKELVSPTKVSEAYAEISLIYETMNDFEIALSLMKKALAILQELPQVQHLEGSISMRIGWLLLLTKRVPQSIPYLESAAEKLKDCFGPKHFGLGFVYKHLGQAYLDMDHPQSAAKVLVLAKDIIDESFGLQHEDAIDTCQCLANAYGAMGRYVMLLQWRSNNA
ncbi:protein KINESIN LIGHT CHAIN-RELATED 2 isoform X2 [Musa acuminata AAA Group]|uniref:protein KINESIN LIGHT CHAIN-RELATED 2 isoform X2 n=1 Tax=Musa acuminata AAA Group TaxID=214697 RepID=UPI0031E43F4D